MTATADRTPVMVFADELTEGAVIAIRCHSRTAPIKDNEGNLTGFASCEYLSRPHLATEHTLAIERLRCRPRPSPRHHPQRGRRAGRLVGQRQRPDPHPPVTPRSRPTEPSPLRRGSAGRPHLPRGGLTCPPRPRPARPRAAPFEAALAEYQRASKKRKRRTPARMVGRRLWKWLRKDPLWALGTLAVVLAVAAGTAWHIYGGRAVAVGAAALGFLVVCEAWPEILRWAHLNRRHFIPVAALALMAAPAALAWRSPYWAALVGLAGLLFVAYSHANLRARARQHSHAAGYIPRAWLPMAYLAAGWTIAAARFGITQRTLAVLLAGWVAWAVRFWFVNRARTASTDLPLAKKWAETIADPDYKHIDSGKKLLGSRLVNVRSVPGGMAATVVLPPGQEGSQVDTRGEVIASVYGTLVTDVTIDESDRREQAGTVRPPEVAAA
jgi:hypothetical protein